jgi:phage tail protein X
VSPRYESPIDPNAYSCRNLALDYRDAIAMTQYPRTLNTIEESGKAHFGLTNHAVRTKLSLLDALC